MLWTWWAVGCETNIDYVPVTVHLYYFPSVLPRQSIYQQYFGTYFEVRKAVLVLRVPQWNLYVGA